MFVALVGKTVAVSVCVEPTASESVVWLSVMLVTGVPLELPTVTWHSATTPLPSLALHNILVLPFATPVTRPVELTFATLELLLVQVTLLLEAFVGCGHAFSWKVFPGSIVVVSVLILIPVTRI